MHHLFIFLCFTPGIRTSHFPIVYWQNILNAAHPFLYFSRVAQQSIEIIMHASLMFSALKSKITTIRLKAYKIYSINEMSKESLRKEKHYFPCLLMHFLCVHSQDSSASIMQHVIFDF